MTKRILFVDDDPLVLSGLERGLRTMRKEWEMLFVTGGPEALDAMACLPFDVVISDMRMPGMDGAELLELVRKNFSQTVRMALSGQSDRDTTFRSIKPTHQYFSKPCDLEELKQKLVRTLALRDVLDNPRLKQLVSQVETVPSLPSLYQALKKLLAAPGASIEAVTGIMVQDMGMAAKVLQLVNSAFLGVPTRHSSATRAVSLLGMENVRVLVSLDLFSELPLALVKPLQDVWTHSHATAAFAQVIAQTQHVNEQCAQDIFTAGLLHDIGQLVLASTSGEEYKAVKQYAADKKVPLVESEERTFGSTHAQVGAYLLGLWGLPDSIVEAVAWHHTPSHAHPAGFSPVIAVHVADFCQRRMSATPSSPYDDPLDHALLAALGLGEHLPIWEKKCQELHLTEPK